MNKKSKTSVPAIDRSVLVLDLLTKSNVPMTGAEIAKELELPRSSAHGILNALETFDLIRKIDERHFVLGAHLMRWANGFLAKQNIVAEFQEALLQMPELESYTLTLSSLSQDQVTYIGCKNSQRPLDITFRVGMFLPAVYTATGKMMLSTLSEEEVKEVVTSFPEPYTSKSVQDFDSLFVELEQVRNQGYAIDNGQVRLGMICFGVAIFDHKGEAHYGVAGSLSEQEANDETKRNELINALKKLATRLTNALGGRTPY